LNKESISGRKKRKQKGKGKNSRPMPSAYEQVLMRPERGMCKIPTAIPIASSVSQTRLTFTAQASSTGYLAVVAGPANGNPVNVYGSIVNETTWGSPTPVGVWSEISSYQVRRFVAGVLNVTNISNMNTVAGAATISIANWSQLGNAFDSFRDIGETVSHHAASLFRQVWLPGDELDLTYTAQAQIRNPNTQSIYFLASGLPSGQTFQFDFRGIVEFVPTPAVMDLVNPTVDAPSGVDVVAKAVAQSRFSKSVFESASNKIFDYLYPGKTYQNPRKFLEIA
jgi:hypothetical protein